MMQFIKKQILTASLLIDYSPKIEVRCGVLVSKSVLY